MDGLDAAAEALEVVELKSFAHHPPEPFQVTPEMKEFFACQGYLSVYFICGVALLVMAKAVRWQRDQVGKEWVNQLLSADEVRRLRGIAESREVYDLSFLVADGDGTSARPAPRNKPGNDLFGMFCRLPRLQETASALLADEVYHHHSKLMMKEARVGGRHLWHQDYGYWYKQGAIRPDMLTVAVALDRCIPENGCLQAVPESHRLGRLDHVTFARQQGAEPERLTAIFAHGGYRKAFVRMEPGDAFFFHSNVLHQSAPNTSAQRRFMLLTAFCAKSNITLDGPAKICADRVQLENVVETAILDWQGSNAPDIQGAEYFDGNWKAPP